MRRLVKQSDEWTDVARRHQPEQFLELIDEQQQFGPPRLAGQRQIAQLSQRSRIFFEPVRQVARLLAQRIAEELAGEGDPRMTILESILRQWATDPKLQPAFLDCAYGKPPPASTPFTLPEDSSLAGKGEAVLSAISKGDLSPDQGAKLLQALIGQARLIEMEELERRIAALEGEAHAES